MHTLCKNAYALVHARLCNGAAASLPWKLLRTYHESCANIVQAVVCRPPPADNPSPDAARFKNPSKSTLAHDAVAAAVLHKHHPIIPVGAGLIQFVYGSRSLLANGGYPSEKCISAIFARVFQGIVQPKFYKRWPQLCRVLRRSLFTTNFVQFSGISVVIKCWNFS